MSCPKGSLPQPLDLAVRTRCRDLYEAGETFANIEAETGVKSATARSWARRDKWQRASETSELVVAESAEISIPEDLSEQAAQYEADIRVAALKFSNHVKNLPPDQIAAKADRIKSLDVVNRKALRIEGEKVHQVIQIGVLCQRPPDERRLYSAVRPRETLESGL